MANEIREQAEQPKRKRKVVKEDWVNHPGHYTKGKYECKDVITDLLMSLLLADRKCA